MGVIIRQGLKSTIVNYLGAIVGGIAVLFIYPLNDEIYGYAQWLYSTVMLLFPFATAGVHSLIVKYYPTYTKDSTSGYGGFMSLILTLLVSVFFLFLVLWFLFRGAIIRLLDFLQIPNTDLIAENQFYLLGLLGFMILLRFFSLFSNTQLRIVVPDIIEKLGFKLFLPILVLSFVYFNFSKHVFALAMLGFFAIASLLMVVYLMAIGKLQFGAIKKPKALGSYKELADYSIYGSLNQLGSTLAVRLDAIMIPLFLSMTQNGFYNKTAFISNILEFPTRSINQIAAPIISKAWEENDLSEIKKIYTKASNNLFLWGSLVFLLIWFTLDDIIGLSSDPSTFPHARMIFLILAGSKMADMITSVNTHIIIYSKKYRYNLIFLLLLGLLNVGLNLWLIPIHGIVGAAMATGISLVLYNFFKLIFIKVSFGIHPFSSGNLKTVILLAIFLLVYTVLPSTSYTLFNLAYKSLLVGLSYGLLAYFWNISEDANHLIMNLLNKLKKA